MKVFFYFLARISHAILTGLIARFLIIIPDNFYGLFGSYFNREHIIKIRFRDRFDRFGSQFFDDFGKRVCLSCNGDCLSQAILTEDTMLHAQFFHCFED
jgi:hypothetical protein